MYPSTIYRVTVKAFITDDQDRVLVVKDLRSSKDILEQLIVEVNDSL